LGALAEGTSRVSGFLTSHDCLATLGCLRTLGIQVRFEENNSGGSSLEIEGRGLNGLDAPASSLNCVRSGTTMRLLTGIMAAQPFDSELNGDDQLLRRPMKRVTEPLATMGAEITTTDGHAPIYIRGHRLSGVHHEMAIASAQVKSAILLAGLFAQGPTSVHSKGPTRDHTERMLALMGVNVKKDRDITTVYPPASLKPLGEEGSNYLIPGDISSAAFPMIAAILLSNSDIRIEGVGINPTRLGLIDVLLEMGADIQIDETKNIGDPLSWEPFGNVTARSSVLRGVEIQGDIVVRMIDEFPILAVAATQASGTTIVHDASELRVKETDRIAYIVSELKAMGASIEALPDGFIVDGPTRLHRAVVNSHGDHRLAMALVIAGLIADDDVVVEGIGCTTDSFPDFLQLIKNVGGCYD